MRLGYSGTLCACLGKGEAAARWLEGAALPALELHAARGDWARAAAIAAASCAARAPAITLHRAQHLELTCVPLPSSLPYNKTSSVTAYKRSSAACLFALSPRAVLVKYHLHRFVLLLHLHKITRILQQFLFLCHS